MDGPLEEAVVLIVASKYPFFTHKLSTPHLMADRLTLFKPGGGADYARLFGASPHLFWTLLQPCYAETTKDT
jgi:hypothetical protein